MKSPLPDDLVYRKCKEHHKTPRRIVRQHLKNNVCFNYFLTDEELEQVSFIYGAPSGKVPFYKR